MDMKAEKICDGRHHDEIKSNASINVMKAFLNGSDGLSTFGILNLSQI